MEQGYKPFEQTLRIEYRPSLILFNVLLTAYIAAFLAIFIAEIFVWTKLLLSVGMFFSLLKSWKAYIEKNRHTHQIRIVLDADDVWHLIEEDKLQELTMLPAAFVHPLLTVLRFVDGKRQKYSFIFTKDNINQDIFRRLRVRLRFSSSLYEDGH